MKNPSQQRAILERVSEKEDKQNRIRCERILSPFVMHTFAAINKPGGPRVYVLAPPGVLTDVDALLGALKETYIRYWLSEDLTQESYVRGSNK